MNIIVCIKQVITGDQVKIDPRTHSLVRSAEFSRINPFDLYALDMAVQLKKEFSGLVTAVTMGPKISEEVLWEALAMGADREPYSFPIHALLPATRWLRRMCWGWASEKSATLTLSFAECERRIAILAR